MINNLGEVLCILLNLNNSLIFYYDLVDLKKNFLAYENILIIFKKIIHK